MTAALVFLVLSLGAVNGADWSYHPGPAGPENWGIDHPLCNGKHQSPVDIQSMMAMYNSSLSPFEFMGYDTDGLQMTLSNSGHTAVVSVSGEAYIMAGGLPGQKFKLVQFHLHWGSDLWHGSEHTYNDMAFPAEIHFVHFNMKYGDFMSALEQPDGLAVLGVFMEAGDYDNNAYAPLIDALPNIIHKDESYSLPSFPLMPMLPYDLDTYYRYQGSLTTPGCFESVTWTVFKDTVSLSPAQLQMFRTLMESAHGEDDMPMVNNYRPVQPMNGRPLWVSRMSVRPPTAAGNVAFGNMGLVLGILALMFFSL